MRNVLFIFSLVVLNFLSATAQSETRFYVETLPDVTGQKGTAEITVGEAIQVTFILENGKNNGRFTPPDWEAAGFVMIGSSQSSSISIMNGETSASASYHYTITPAMEGTWTIPSVSIKNGDMELHTEPITIKALPNADGVSPALPKRSPAQPPNAPKKKYKTIRM